MKFLWQQIIGFLLVMLLALAIGGYRMSEYMTQKIYYDKEQQLLNYGKNIVSNNFTRSDLLKASQLLASEKIFIQVYLEDGRIIYPTYDQRYDSNLSQEDLATINSGKVVGLRTNQAFAGSEGNLQFTTVYLPINYDVGAFPAGFISLGAPLDGVNKQIEEAQKSIQWSLGIATGFGILASIIYAMLQTQKIKQLQTATKRVASGQYDVKLNLKGQDEFGDLARDFQGMIDSLLASQEEIKRQESLRRQFMMDAAHEMRTPLTTMSGLLEGLQHDLIPESQRDRCMELINKETQRLIRLVNENLDYEKIRSHQFTLNKQLINGREFFALIRQQMETKAAEKNDTVRFEVDSDLVIWADYDRLVQIVINLTTNAIQFSENEEILLVGKNQPDGVVIQVIDHGIGIDASQIKSIWERFYKVDISRKNTKFGESGIGLSVVHSLVDAHGGTIDVESELGKGSTFTIKLPHAPQEGHDDQAEVDKNIVKKRK
ncbi:sensor histidine kinase [Vaginisenegalia massiliensis]|uniref:sensor histidine kinase n=1 Tax=Vaginisenegalia massiliensis TaxID=2058294 RepID=UPI000F5243DD|nr:HAMP domain-containing sensor histidine kinase [Vaginisenegalia massiliensis]